MKIFKREINRIKEALMTGVGYMIPFVVFGGICIAFSIAFSDMSSKGVNITNPVLKMMNTFGTQSMGMMVPILAAFTAFGFADRAGIMPGFLGGLIAVKGQAGFLGGLIAGILAGYIVMAIKKIPIPATLRALVPIFIVPLLGGLTVAVIMQYIVIAPIGGLMKAMTAFLQNMQGGNALLLAAILGFMTAFDMGGPVNVVACLFAWSFFESNIYTLSAPVAVAIATPPLGMGLATLMARNKYDEIDRESGKAALVMGLIGISEGAIPFAAKDPFRVIPANCLGGVVGGVIAMMGGVNEYAPHGGPIVTIVATNKLWYLLAIIVGALVTAITSNILKFGFNFRDKKSRSSIKKEKISGVVEQ